MKGKIDEYSDSDDDQHDAYLERMKAEGKIREEGNDSDESDAESGEWLDQTVRLVDESEAQFVQSVAFLSLFTPDESFNPGEEDDDIAEEWVTFLRFFFNLLILSPSLPGWYNSPTIPFCVSTSVNQVWQQCLCEWQQWRRGR